MSLWVKICGNTSLDDARLAVDAGADALGFVFAPSPRQVTPEQVAAMTPHLASAVEKIGVFVEADLHQIAATVTQCGLTGVQLHEAHQAKMAGVLRQQFGASLRILQVIHYADDAKERFTALRSDSNLDGILIDSRTATAVGGTGIPFDWQAAATSIFGGERNLSLIAAGGLRPANVAQAIALLQPWGVDVASGVEAAPGRKDAEKVREFVRLARAAAALSHR